MAISFSQPIAPWIAKRILDFFNQALVVADITDGPIQDDPSDGAGNTIGPVVARRILKVRNETYRGRFTDISQLDDVKGVGEDTMQDLVYSFGTTAAQDFQNRMYDDYTIFRENWPLEFFRTELTFDDEEGFEKFVRDEAAFRTWVYEKVKEISDEREVSEENRDAMLADIKTGYIDTYNNSIQTPGFALALWFYEFDADNWFGWETIQHQTLAYFDYHMQDRNWEMELRFFRGFVNRGIIQPGIAASDLPVVVNWPEQCITLWFSALYD